MTNIQITAQLAGSIHTQENYVFNPINFYHFDFLQVHVFQDLICFGPVKTLNFNRFLYLLQRFKSSAAQLKIYMHYYSIWITALDRNMEQSVRFRRRLKKHRDLSHFSQAHVSLASQLG